ncbi:MAG: endonuclease/exonuclease/phosphatase family protein [Kineosporiaceae bacterium]
MTDRLRVASLNLFSGRSLGPTGPVATSPEALVEAVAGLDADVLALQEVDVDQPRSGGQDQVSLARRALAGLVPEALAGGEAAAGDAGTAEESGTPVTGAFAPAVAGTPGEPGWSAAPRVLHHATPPRGPLFGVALVTRRPVISWHRHDLGRVPGRYPLPLPGGDRRLPRVLWLREEPRVLVAVRLADPEVTVACTHVSFVPGASLVQLHRAKAWLVQTLPPPYLLLGDLNLPAGAAAGGGWEPLLRTPTYPAPAPRMQLDHVLGHGLDGWSVSAAAAHRLAVGDHLAVTVDLARRS